MRGDHGLSLVMGAAPDPGILHSWSGTVGQPRDVKLGAERDLPATIDGRTSGAKPDHCSAVEPDLTR
jgi:hypothetical protein